MASISRYTREATRPGLHHQSIKLWFCPGVHGSRGLRRLGQSDDLGHGELFKNIRESGFYREVPGSQGLCRTDCMTTMPVRTQVAEYMSTQSKLYDPCVATVV